MSNITLTWKAGCKVEQVNKITIEDVNKELDSLTTHEVDVDMIKQFINQQQEIINSFNVGIEDLKKHVNNQLDYGVSNEHRNSNNKATQRW